MSDCGGEEESSCQSKTDRSEDLSTLPVCSDEPGPSHSRLRKDAGGVDSMSTAGPSSATGMRKDWHENMTQDLRNDWVRRLASVLPLTPDLLVNARKIEGDIYESANSKREYDQLITEKINMIQKEERKRLQRPSLDFGSTSMDQPLCDSDLTMDPNTKLHQSADKTEASSHFTPELLNESGAISYRFTCPGPGVFWCKLTKLVFTMDQEGELSYRTVQWDENLLQLNGKRPAGLLFDIKCSEDAVSKLHLPHCEINPAPLCLSVVHISDDGMSFLEPLEITDTHVVVDVPHLSAFGLVWDIIKRFFNPDPEPISGQVLLFHRPAYMKQSPKLNVFLLPENVPLQEVKGQHENAEYIEAPSFCELIVDQTYSLHCSEDLKVVPEGARFKLNYGPNYHKTFEIRLSPGTDEVTVMIQDQDNKEVWEYPVELPGKEGLDPRRENLQRTQILSGDEERRLFSVRKKFIDSVSSSVLQDLLDALLQHEVINSGEMESIQVMSSRADKARELIDTVRKKGKQACKILIDTFCEVDPFVSDMLGLKQ